jgi:exoribonuclease R
MNNNKNNNVTQNIAAQNIAAQNIAVQNIAAQNIAVQGNVIKRGLFLGIDTHNFPKTEFIQNHLYSQLLPADNISYILEHNRVKVLSINSRQSFQTVAICTNYDQKSGKYFFFTPLLPRNYSCFIKENNSSTSTSSSSPSPSYKKNHLYIIQINLKYNKIIQEFGDINSRQDDHKILCSIYSNISHINLDINIESGNAGNAGNAGNVGNSVVNKNYYTKSYRNLQHLNTFNIDPVQSKDFDDALSVDIANKKIYIHIVDANQLYLNNKIEKNAAKIGLTFYTHLLNSNMLPNDLAENRFSLIRGQKRNVITVELTLDLDLDCDKGKGEGGAEGKYTSKKLPVKSYEIYKSTIIVKNRYNYDDVLQYESESESESETSFDNKMIETFAFLKDLTNKYYQRKLNIVQPSYNIDNNGNLTGIYYENMNSWSHRLIEMMMINTNRIVTEHMNSLNIKIPQRIHPKPIIIDAENNITGDELIDSVIMIQKYKNASYDKNNNGHFGLDLQYYTHFTSPIRRYNDIIVMRMIEGFTYTNLDELLTHINKREELNGDLEKLYKKWKLMGFLSSNISQIFDAHIVNITHFGIKFYIKELGFDGFIQHTFINNKDLIEIGNVVKVKCTKVDFTSFNDILWNIIQN